MFTSRKDISYGIIGLGRFGFPLAKKLAEAGMDCIVIDDDEAKLQEIRKYTEYAYLVQDLNKEALQETGIHHCGTVVVCIAEKMDVSIFTTLNLINLGVKRVIAKAASYEQGEVLKKLGAEVVFPEEEMAVRLASNLLTSSNVSDYISLNKNIHVAKLEVTGALAGRTIRDLYLRQAYGLNIIAVENEKGTTIEIVPEYTLQEKDILVVIGREESISDFEGDIASNAL